MALQTINELKVEVTKVKNRKSFVQQLIPINIPTITDSIKNWQFEETLLTTCYSSGFVSKAVNRCKILFILPDTAIGYHYIFVISIPYKLHLTPDL